MERIISKYKDGDHFAREELIGSIMKEYSYSLTRDEAIILLHKKYGKTEKF